jgi:hypothetical protein
MWRKGGERSIVGEGKRCASLSLAYRARFNGAHRKDLLEWGSSQPSLA